MAYNGYVDSSDCARKTREEVVTAEKWSFNNIIVKDTIYGKMQCINEADLAELYEPMRLEIFTPGSLVRFGGEKEIIKTQPNDRHFFSVVSTAPGIVLNHKDDEKGIKVVLVGKVPCRAIGEVHKFKKLTTSHIPGVAKEKTLLDILLFKPTIGIALETNLNYKEKLVNIFTKAKF